MYIVITIQLYQCNKRVWWMCAPSKCLVHSDVPDNVFMWKNDYTILPHE